MVIYDFILPPRKLKPDTFPESMAVPSRDGAAHRPQGKTKVRGHTPSAAPARSPGARRSAREQLQRFPEPAPLRPPGSPGEALGRQETVWPWRGSRIVFWSSRGGQEKEGRKERTSRDSCAHLPAAAFGKQSELLGEKGKKRGRGRTVRHLLSQPPEDDGHPPCGPGGSPGARDPAGGAEQRGSLFKGSNKGSRKNKGDGN